MARSLHLSFICIPQSTRALDQGGVEPRQAVSPKALRPWTIPLRYSVGSLLTVDVKFYTYLKMSLILCGLYLMLQSAVQWKESGIALAMQDLFKILG